MCFWLIPRGLGLDFISFLFVGGSGVLSHRAYFGDILFFIVSLLQRRRTLSDFGGLTLAIDGKKQYFSFSTLRPGLLLCSDLCFCVIKEFNNNTQAQIAQCCKCAAPEQNDGKKERNKIQ